MAKREYKAYLLRLWREKQDGSWRATLENPNSGERASFATLADLVVFLADKTGETIQAGSAFRDIESKPQPESL